MFIYFCNAVEKKFQALIQAICDKEALCKFSSFEL